MKLFKTLMLTTCFTFLVFGDSLAGTIRYPENISIATNGENEWLFINGLPDTNIVYAERVSFAGKEPEVILLTDFQLEEAKRWHSLGYGGCVLIEGNVKIYISLRNSVNTKDHQGFVKPGIRGVYRNDTEKSANLEKRVAKLEKEIMLLKQESDQPFCHERDSWVGKFVLDRTLDRAMARKRVAKLEKEIMLLQQKLVEKE